MPEEEQKNHNLFLYVLLFSCLVVLIASFYSFYIRKDYNFIVETSCDNTKETCFYRDCSVEGDCPPNHLSYYNRYTIKANDFHACKDEDCTAICAEGGIACLKTECTDDDIANEICIAPEPVVEEVAVPVVEDIKINKKK